MLIIFAHKQRATVRLLNHERHSDTSVGFIISAVREICSDYNTGVVEYSGTILSLWYHIHIYLRFQMSQPHIHCFPCVHGDLKATLFLPLIDRLIHRPYGSKVRTNTSARPP